MSLQSSPEISSDSPPPEVEDRVIHFCRLAREFEEAGDYEKAEAVLGEFWKGVGTEPDVGGLGGRAAAELLLRAGAVTRRLGRADAAAGVQETAKDLISRSIHIFERLNLREKVAEAQSELAYCYWRKGELDNARVLLKSAVEKLRDPDLKAEAMLRLSVVEGWAGQLRTALEVLGGAASLVGQSSSRALKGRFHLEEATLLKDLGWAEQSDELIDAALIEYAAARYHFEEAGHPRNVGLVENQLGYLLLRRGSYDEAHAHLRRARHIFVGLGDGFRAAQVDETRAQGYLGQGKFREAERAAAAAVAVLEKCDTHALLAEALTTCGRARSRGGDAAAARATLLRAVEAARLTGEAALTASTLVAAIEELFDVLRTEELVELYAEADDLLGGAEDGASRARLHACAGLVIKAVREKGTAPTLIGSGVEAITSLLSAPTHRVSWRGFSLADVILRIEEVYIRHALRDTGGSVTKAAILLGLRHPESLNSKINKLGLQGERTPIRPRRRSIIGKRLGKTRAGKNAGVPGRKD